MSRLPGLPAFNISRSTAGSLLAGARLLINAQIDERRLDDWRGDAVFPPAFDKIAEDTVHFDGRLFFAVTIHRRGQRGSRSSELRALFRQECLRDRIAARTRDGGTFTKGRER